MQSHFDHTPVAIYQLARHLDISQDTVGSQKIQEALMSQAFCRVQEFGYKSAACAASPHDIEFQGEDQSGCWHRLPGQHTFDHLIKLAACAASLMVKWASHDLL